ncbi:MAG: ATP-binding protein [Niastella sp.]|nr:ATP-binding protein [Niastella sp.]
MRRVLLTILLLTTGFLSTTTAQEARQKLNVLFHQLRQTSSATARVDLLCDIASVYMHGFVLPTRKPDSALYYSKQALALSKKIHYIKGYWEALDHTYDSYAIANNIDKAFEVIENIYDTHVVRILYSSGVVYQGSIWRKPNRDSALIIYRKALMISERIGNEFFICESKIRILCCYAMMGDTTMLLREMKMFERESKLSYVAEAWRAIGNVVPEAAGYLAFRLYCHQRALDLYRSLGDKWHIGEVLLKIGDLYDDQGNTISAERYYLEATTLLKQTTYPKLYKALLRLHDLYYYRGDLDKAVHYSLEAERSAKKNDIKDFPHFFRYNDDTSKPGQVEKNDHTYATLLKGTVRTMVKEGKAREALDYALADIRRGSNYSALTNMIYAEVLGICYGALGRYQEAEQSYLQMREYVSSLKEQYAALAPYTIGKFYYENKEYTRAAPYLQQYLRIPRQFTAMTGVSEAHLFLYRIDSARQDHTAALQHFRAYKDIADSIFNTTKSQQIAELKVQYDIEKKDQTLLLQQKDIELLTRQKLLQQSLAEQKSKDILLKQQNIDMLKQQQSMQEMTSNRQQRELERKEKELGLQVENIGLLHNKELLQESQLRQANFIKRMTVAGIVLLLIIVGLLYNQYRIKYRNNQAISKQNDLLHNLLEEKEWLLKEVHHRVKNNLQVVVSLLQSQSVYLKDEALAAVNDSQHRVQAMSLIHQKLYQSDNISAINMEMYIPELMAYLKESFITATRITFITDIDPIGLEVTQAVPLGLIINEAVTNIFKHAFTGRERGQVNISLKRLNAAELVLAISDNGTGLPADPASYSKSSLGLNLMKGLCNDFNGRYTIESKDGTHIQIVFNRHIYQTTASSELQPTSHEA